MDAVHGAPLLFVARSTPRSTRRERRHTADADVVKFLKLFTDLPLERIDELARLEGQAINEAKIVLANEATSLLHGRDAAEIAAETARRTFEEGAAGGDLPTIAAPSEGISIIDANTGLGFAASNKEVKRKIDEGAIRVNDAPVTDYAHVVRPGDKISFGKKKHGLVVDG
jgi:tyrosyl-tRNA synthetase